MTAVVHANDSAPLPLRGGLRFLVGDFAAAQHEGQVRRVAADAVRSFGGVPCERRDTAIYYGEQRAATGASDAFPQAAHAWNGGKGTTHGRSAIENTGRKSSKMSLARSTSNARSKTRSSRTR